MFLTIALYTRVQSFLLRGDQIFQPLGQEFFSVLLDTFKPLLTLMTLPAEYPETGTLVTLQFDGLPAAQLTAVCIRVCTSLENSVQHPLLSTTEFQKR